MTFDPTTNRIQWYLLTDEEKAAMQAWPYGWEFNPAEGWSNIQYPGWFGTNVYRAKPKPVVTSTWQNIYPFRANFDEHSSRELADECARDGRIAVLRRDTVNGVTTAHLEDV